MSIDEDVEKLEPLHNVNENIKWHIHFGNQVVLLIVKRQLPYIKQQFHLRLYLREFIKLVHECS